MLGFRQGKSAHRMTFFWNAYGCCRTCSVHGCFSACAPAREQTSTSGLCRRSRARNLPRDHDEAMFRTLHSMLDGPAIEDAQMPWVQGVAQQPLRAGGLGLRSAVRLAPAAYWASWADCLHMIRQRHPLLANSFLQSLQAEAPLEPSLAALVQARTQLMWEGYAECPA